MMCDQREEVVEALPSLRDGIAGRHEIGSRVTRNLSGDEEPATDTIGVTVVRCLRKSRAQFAFIHRWVHRSELTVHGRIRVSNNGGCYSTTAPLSGATRSPETGNGLLTMMSAIGRTAKSANPPRLIAMSLFANPSVFAMWYTRCGIP